jgi:predicted RNA-binding protein with TRAM domain
MNWNDDSRDRDSRDNEVAIGEQHDVKIEDVSRKGDGVARIKGLIVFVPNTKKGDEVTIKITRRMPKFAIGERVEN